LVVFWKIHPVTAPGRVQKLAINEFSREKINKSVAELKEEKLLVGELLRA
jgi:hypothetical protein